HRPSARHESAPPGRCRRGRFAVQQRDAWSVRRRRYLAVELSGVCSRRLPGEQARQHALVHCRDRRGLVLMRALLLAAGLGTRLRPLTDTVPKAMVDIAGRPLLGRWLAMLFQGGIERVLVNTHYLGPVIRTFVRSSPWSGSIDLVDEAVLLGTG